MGSNRRELDLDVGLLSSLEGGSFAERSVGLDVIAEICELEIADLEKNAVVDEGPLSG